MESTIEQRAGGDTLVTGLTRARELRTVFHLALDRPRAGVRARLRPGGATSTVKACAFSPVRSLFEQREGILRADFEYEAYFGAGWSDPHATPAGPVRQGQDGATLLLPLERGRDYRLLLDLAAERPIEVALNGEGAGSCDLSTRPCEIVLRGASIVNGINSVGVPRQGEPPGRRPGVAFRGARIVSEPTPRR